MPQSNGSKLRRASYSSISMEEENSEISKSYSSDKRVRNTRPQSSSKFKEHQKENIDIDQPKN